MKVKALNDKLLASEIERGEERSRGGIVLLDDNATEKGIRPRWMQVYSKGDDVTEEIQEGDWIYVEHGRWTRGMTVRTNENTELTLWGIDIDSVLLVSDEKPDSERLLR
jgi:co-chaperonin GroES (HSP10)